MTSKVWSKPVTQSVIKNLRANGVEVTKTNSGYQGKLSGELVFTALRGNRGYLVRYPEGLFAELLL